MSFVRSVTPQEQKILDNGGRLSEQAEADTTVHKTEGVLERDKRIRAELEEFLREVMRHNGRTSSIVNEMGGLQSVLHRINRNDQNPSSAAPEESKDKKTKAEETKTDKKDVGVTTRQARESGMIENGNGALSGEVTMASRTAGAVASVHDMKGVVGELVRKLGADAKTDKEIKERDDLLRMQRELDELDSSLKVIASISVKPEKQVERRKAA